MNKRKHSISWYVKYTYPLVKFFCTPLIKLIWLKSVTGLEHIPRTGPAIIAFNHQSYFDFITFFSICPRPIHFLSAEKFFSHLFWAPFMYLSGQIRVDRKNHDKHFLHEEIHNHLEDGKIIGIFPEGTRSHSSTEMLHAFSGVAKSSVRARVPVIPVGIKGAYEVMSRHDKKPKFSRSISIHIGKPLHFVEHHNKEHDEVVYRELTDRVMLELSKLSGKDYKHVGKLVRDSK